MAPQIVIKNFSSAKKFGSKRIGKLRFQTYELIDDVKCLSRRLANSNDYETFEFTDSLDKDNKEKQRDESEDKHLTVIID